MIAEDKRVQDIDPASPAKVDVKRSTDARGGAIVEVSVTTDNCGADDTRESPRHALVLNELDGYTEIMATYRFEGGFACWNIFGDPDLRANLIAFDPTRDAIDMDQNMARTTSGASVPYDGKTQFCAPGKDNFWKEDYASDPKQARVTLRRRFVTDPSGLSTIADCSGIQGGWSYRDIYVR